MSIGIAQIKQIYGLRSGVSNCIAYQDEQTLVYPAGSNIVLYNIDQKVQKFIPCTDKSSALTTVCVSPNRRYIAIAEKVADKPLVSIYDLHTLRKRKVLSTGGEAQYGTSTEIVSMAFSNDSKNLITQGASPDWTLVYWAWEKSKIMASIKVTQNVHIPTATVTQVSFNPQDNTQLCVVGNNIYKMYRYLDGTLKNYLSLKQESHYFISHAWLSDERVLVGNNKAQIFLIQNGEILMEHSLYDIKDADFTNRPMTTTSSINSQFGAANKAAMTNGDSNEVTSIIPYSKGFVVSCGRGKAFLYERQEDKEYFRRIRELKVPADANSADPSKAEDQLILSMCMSPSEETLLVVTNWQQIYQLSFSNVDVGRSDHAEFEFMSYSFHHASVTGVDVCIRKPLIATCSIDRSIRIWNYESGALEIYKELAEEAYSISLHPSGLYILVGLSDKLRLMNILIDDIREFKAFNIRGCKECQFSNGGNLFAAVHGNAIQIYSTTTFENVSNLKGHNGKVKQLIWSNDDSKLISCGMDGAVYEWETSSGKRTGESVLKNCSYSSIAINPEARNIFAVGSDRKLKEISDSQVLREVDVNEDDVIPTSVALSRSGRMLFVGTSKGTIRSYKFPLTNPSEYQEHLAHTSSVTRIKVTFNDEYMISSADDASVVVWKIQDKEGRTIKRDKDFTYADEILITKTDLEEKNTLMRDLNNRVKELKSENEYALRLKELSNSEKIKELTDKFIQEMESLKTKNQVLKNEKDKAESNHEYALSELREDHNKQLHELETTSNTKLMVEFEKYQDLQSKTQKIQEDHERQLQEMEQSRDKALYELEQKYKNDKQKLEDDKNKLMEEIKQSRKEYEETQRQTEEDADTEIVDIKTKYEKRLREQMELNEKIMNEAGNIKKRISRMEKDAEDFKEKIKQLQTEIQKKENMIKGLTKDIEGYKKEIQERDDTIQDKEKRIYDLKKKNQELEKFKFVLDYKIKEQKKMVEPRELEIKDLKEEKTKMESELERFNKQNTQLVLEVKRKQDELNALKDELKSERLERRDSEWVLKRIKTDIHNCSGLMQDPKQFLERFKAVYQKYVHDDVSENANIDQDIQKEYARQREHLEKTVNSLKFKLAKDSERHKADNIRTMQENVTLIKEVNDLRKELKVARSKCQDLEVALGISRKNAVSTTDALVQALHVHQGNHLVEEKQSELQRIIEHQKAEIKRLRETIEDLERARQSRPSSNQLPPLSVK